MKKIIAWAGFVDGKITDTLDYFGDRYVMPSVYVRKKDAKKLYEDVRKVEIKIIKK